METLIPAWRNGVLTPVEKIRVHREGLRHKAVSVFVLRGDAILIQRRALSKYHTPGLWANACCTHPFWDEDPGACAERRLGEELGMSGVELRKIDRVEYRADVGGGMIEHEVVDIYRGVCREADPLAPAPQEVMATRWIGFDELEREIGTAPERFTPWLRIYMKGDLAQALRE